MPCKHVRAAALGACLLWAQAWACEFDKLPNQRIRAFGGVSFELQGITAFSDCALHAAASGMNAATSTTLESGSTRCRIFSLGVDKCHSVELDEPSVSMLNIRRCNTTLVTDGQILLDDAEGLPLNTTGVTGKEIRNVRAVGRPISGMHAVAAAECLQACTHWVPGCTTVVITGTEGALYCEFHASPTKGQEMAGPTTYHDLKVGEVSEFELGKLGVLRNVGDLDPPVGASAPALAPGAVPGAPDAAPGTAGGAANASAPGATAEAPGATGPGQAPDAAPAEAPLDGPTPQAFVWPLTGACPNPGTPKIKSGVAPLYLTPPTQVLDQYTDVIEADGTFRLPFYVVDPGTAICSAKGAASLVTMGGTVTFQDKQGKCQPPPAAADGKPCCSLWMWQPNAAGLYLPNCAVRIPLDPETGVYWFKTEMPGDETAVGWGPDPEPHIHYWMHCSKCSGWQSLKGFAHGSFNHPGKMYPKDFCKLPGCVGAGPDHQMELVQTAAEGGEIYVYHIVNPADESKWPE